MGEVRAALYARVSSEQQAAAHTIESQLASLTERAQADGAPIPPERQFVDDGYSGATLVRPALDHLRDLVMAGAIDRIYVHSPDRLARNYAYQVLLVDEWRRASVDLVFLNRPLGQSPEDDLLLQVQGIVAEYERAKIMERSRRGKKHAAQRGSLNVMSGAPFGYHYIKVRDGSGQARFEIVPEEPIRKFGATCLQLEILALRHQINVLRRSQRGRVRLSSADRLFWTRLMRFWSGWRSALAIVKPETVISCLANPLWGAPRIHGELLKLGIDVSQATVARYMVDTRRPPSQTWRAFLNNHVCPVGFDRFLRGADGDLSGLVCLRRARPPPTTDSSFQRHR